MPSPGPSSGHRNASRGVSAPHDDVGYRRIPVANQVCSIFDDVPLIPYGARYGFGSVRACAHVLASLLI